MNNIDLMFDIHFDCALNSILTLLLVGGQILKSIDLAGIGVFNASLGTQMDCTV